MALSGHQILVRPIVTEKNTMLNEVGKYCFEVIQASNKIEIKRAVEEVFSVHVTHVNIIKVPGKMRRMASLWSGLPGTMAGSPSSGLAVASSRRSSRSFALRAAESTPWQVKQFSERIGRMSRLYSRDATAARDGISTKPSKANERAQTENFTRMARLGRSRNTSCRKRVDAGRLQAHRRRWLERWRMRSGSMVTGS